MSDLSTQEKLNELEFVKRTAAEHGGRLWILDELETIIQARRRTYLNRLEEANGHTSQRDYNALSTLEWVVDIIGMLSEYDDD